MKTAAFCTRLDLIDLATILLHFTEMGVAVTSRSALVSAAVSTLAGVIRAKHEGDPDFQPPEDLSTALNILANAGLWKTTNMTRKLVEGLSLED